MAARLAAERVDVRAAAADRAAAESLLYRAEEAWSRSDAEAVWRQLEGPLDRAQRYWRALVGGPAGASAFRGPRFTVEEAASAYEAALALAAARVQVLLLLGHLEAALHQAEEFHGWHEGVVAGLTPVDVAAARSRHLADAEGLTEEDARSRLLRSSRPLFEGVREVQLNVACLPKRLRLLAARGISGRDYVEAQRNATDVPIVALPAP